MRMLMRVQMDVEAANAAIGDGSFAQIMEGLMRDAQPEAAYFTATEGKRTGFIVFDLKEPSDMPMIAEPFFTGVKASIDMTPVMTMEDVQAGLGKLAGAAATA